MTPHERRIQYLTIAASDNKRMMDHNGGSQKFGQKYLSENSGRQPRRETVAFLSLVDEGVEVQEAARAAGITMRQARDILRRRRE